MSILNCTSTIHSQFEPYINHTCTVFWVLFSPFSKKIISRLVFIKNNDFLLTFSNLRHKKCCPLSNKFLFFVFCKISILIRTCWWHLGTSTKSTYALYYTVIIRISNFISNTISFFVFFFLIRWFSIIHNNEWKYLINYYNFKNKNTFYGNIFLSSFYLCRCVSL